MKKLIIILLVVFPVLLFAQENNKTLWEKANKEYASEEYQKAIASYSLILESGQESAKLYFNLGNAYYKTGDVNHAILNYERAKLLAPQDEDIAFNLKIANQFVVTKTEDLPLPFFVCWRNGIINKYKADTWAHISVVAFIVLLVLLGGFFFGRRGTTKRFAFWLGILALLISGFSFSFAARQKKNVESHGHAIVFCPRVTVKSSPSEAGTDLFLIYEGLKVRVIKSRGKWEEIRLSDGNQGWLRDSCIVKI